LNAQLGAQYQHCSILVVELCPKKSLLNSQGMPQTFRLNKELCIIQKKSRTL